MSIETDARQAAEEYTRRHIGGMQPVETVGDKVRAAFIAGAVWAREQDTREPSADTGCPHEAFEIDTAGNPTRCADCGDHLAAVPGREPSDAEVRDEAEALYPLNRESPDVIIALRSAYRAGVDREGRAALLAAQEVRRG